MSKRFVMMIDDDKNLPILIDSQKYEEFNLYNIDDVRKLCEVINGINDVKKENLERLKEVSKDNELLYDAVNGFMALLELQYEEKLQYLDEKYWQLQVIVMICLDCLYYDEVCACCDIGLIYPEDDECDYWEEDE